MNIGVGRLGRRECPIRLSLHAMGSSRQRTPPLSWSDERRRVAHRDSKGPSKVFLVHSWNDSAKDDG